LRQHGLVNGLDLVREGANAGEAHGELVVVSVGQANPGGLDQQAQPFRIRGLDRRQRFPIRAEECRRFCGRDNRLFESAVGQPDPALVTGRAISTQGPDVLEQDRDIEVPRQRDLPSDLG